MNNNDKTGDMSVAKVASVKEGIELGEAPGIGHRRSSSASTTDPGTPRSPNN